MTDYIPNANSICEYGIDYIMFIIHNYVSIINTVN